MSNRARDLVFLGLICGVSAWLMTLSMSISDAVAPVRRVTEESAKAAERAGPQIIETRGPRTDIGTRIASESDSFSDVIPPREAPTSTSVIAITDPREVTEDTLADWIATCGKDPGVARELWRTREDVREAWKTIQHKRDVRDATLYYFRLSYADYVKFSDPGRIRDVLAPIIDEMRAMGVEEDPMQEALDEYEAEVTTGLWLAGEEAESPNCRWKLNALLNATQAVKEAATLLDTLIPDVH